jgi:hypothetical protein
MNVSRDTYYMAISEAWYNGQPRPGRGAWMPRAYTLGLSYEGARMRPKKDIPYLPAPEVAQIQHLRPKHI